MNGVQFLPSTGRNAMNDKILMGLGAAVIAWGAVALAYDDTPTGAALIAVGAALVAVAVRWSRNKK